MKLDFVPCDSPPPQLRDLYFRTLPEPQIHYLEQRVGASRVFRFGGVAPETAGYAAIHDGAVVEFFAGDNWLPRLSEAFCAAAAQGGATSAVVKSYDALALVAATGREAQVMTIGVNFTTWSDERFDPPAGFVPRVGNAGDQDLVIAIGPGLFEAPEEIQGYLDAGKIIVYELDGEPTGCGVLSPVRQGSDAFDIGVGVLPAWRGEGLGGKNVRHLKVHCLHELKVRPTCGCAVENIASRRTLEKAAFLSKHRLLEFTWRA